MGRNPMGGRQRPSDALDAVSDDGVMEQITPRLLSWASVIDEQSLEQARRTAEMPFVFPHVALMPDAHLGIGATVGSVIPTDRRDHPGGGRRRHRLRHDRGPDPVPGRGPRRAAAAAPAPVHRAGRPALGRRGEPPGRRHRGAAGRRARGRGRSGRPRPSTALRQVARAAGHPRLRQPLHRGVPRRAGPGVGVPALGLPGGGQQDRPAPHRGRPPADAARPGPPARPGPRLPRRGHRRVRRLHPATCAGRSTSRCSTARR